MTDVDQDDGLSVEVQAYQAKEVQQFLKHRALEDTMKRAQHYAAIARDALALFPASEMKQALEEAVEFCTVRTH